MPRGFLTSVTYFMLKGCWRCTSPNSIITWEFWVCEGFFYIRTVANFILFCPCCVILLQLYHPSIEKYNLVSFSLSPSLSPPVTYAHTHTSNYFIKTYNHLRWQFWQKCTACNQSDKQWLVIAVTAVACEASDSSEVHVKLVTALKSKVLIENMHLKDANFQRKWQLFGWKQLIQHSAYHKSWLNSRISTSLDFFFSKLSRKCPFLSVGDMERLSISLLTAVVKCI